PAEALNERLVTLSEGRNRNHTESGEQDGKTHGNPHCAGGSSRGKAGAVARLAVRVMIREVFWIVLRSVRDRGQCGVLARCQASGFRYQLSGVVQVSGV